MTSDRISGIVEVRIRSFVLATYAFTWIPMLIMIGLHVDVSRGPAQIVFAVAACGPSLMAGAMWLAYPRERRTPRRPVWWSIPLGLVLGAAIPCLPALVLNIADLGVLMRTSSVAVASAGGLIGFLGVTLLAGPLAEEFGWRGYLQPRVRRSRGVPASTLAIGLIWALWHLPLFFLRGTGQQAAGLFSVRGMSLLVGLIPFSLVMLFLVERLRGSVFAAVAAHFGFNGGDSIIPNPGALGMLLELIVLLVIACVAAILMRDSDRSRNAGGD